MAIVHSFTFSMFSENTYIVYDETQECVIIDPGCYDKKERDRLAQFIKANELKPVRLLNTHCHIDHIFGNRFVAETYNLELEIHKGELPVLQAFPVVAQMYGIGGIQQSPDASKFLEEGDQVKFGNTTFDVLLTPGHSPASICFYNKAENFVIAGDVLFERSIGRTDLPGGNYETLMNSIFDKLLPLGDEVIVYPGHGNATSIGLERKSNPFVREEFMRRKKMNLI
ncbi:MAG: MBL fold metallo-hydrolase [Saprospiraceae bacterium]|nr:MBL fold metallo-hydrolase [Saprospiraceae bacterium]